MKYLVVTFLTLGSLNYLLTVIDLVCRIYSSVTARKKFHAVFGRYFQEKEIQAEA